MAREHAEIIGHYCSCVVLVFDSDRAGEQATERGIGVLLRQGLDVSVLRLPDGEDPDTFVRAHGKDGFEVVDKYTEGKINDVSAFTDFLRRNLGSSEQ